MVRELWEQVYVVGHPGDLGRRAAPRRVAGGVSKTWYLVAITALRFDIHRHQFRLPPIPVCAVYPPPPILGKLPDEDRAGPADDARQRRGEPRPHHRLVQGLPA